MRCRKTEDVCFPSLLPRNSCGWGQHRQAGLPGLWGCQTGPKKAPQALPRAICLH